MSITHEPDNFNPLEYSSTYLVRKPEVDAPKAFGFRKNDFPQGDLFWIPKSQCRVRPYAHNPRKVQLEVKHWFADRHHYDLSKI